jgi:hypothetical protein
MLQPVDAELQGLDAGDIDGWVTLHEAAAALGISVDTVRRRLKRGEMDGRQVPTKFGPSWEVRLGVTATYASAPRSMHPPAASTPDANVPPLDVAPYGTLNELVGLIERQQTEHRLALEQKDRTIMELAGRCGFLQGQLQATQERLLMLEAGPSIAEPEPVQEASSDAPRAPWWQRLFSGDA